MVLAKDENDNEVDPPMEIYVLVDDVNDNAPVCDEETVFEFQENEPVGKDASVEVRNIHMGGGFFTGSLLNSRIFPICKKVFSKFHDRREGFSLHLLQVAS